MLDAEGDLGADGTVKVEIDTSLAQAMFGSESQKYEIKAEVTDASRRTIYGGGNVLVAARPFKVYAWVDCGFYRVGDTVRAHFCARRLDGKPVTGKGVLRLMRLSYDADGKPKENEAERWTLNPGEDGNAEIQINAKKAGQYRLSYKLKDSRGQIEEGGYVLNVWGEGHAGDTYRFTAIEVTPQKASYQPDEEMKLRISTAREDSTVLLFLRPTNGVYVEPAVLRLKGKSVEQVVKIAKRDMPNFFIEAVSVSDGQVHRATRQVVVPPEKRVLDVKAKVVGGKEEDGTPRFKPGQKAKVEIELRDATGEPYSGSVVLTMYDKALEYISGGSNVPEIKEFFWGWKRSHHPNGRDSLARASGNLIPPGQPGMNNLGVFGATAVDEYSYGAKAKGEGGRADPWSTWLWLARPGSGALLRWMRRCRRRPRRRWRYGRPLPSPRWRRRTGAMRRAMAAARARWRRPPSGRSSPTPPSGRAT